MLIYFSLGVHVWGFLSIHVIFGIWGLFEYSCEEILYIFIFFGSFFWTMTFNQKIYSTWSFWWCNLVSSGDVFPLRTTRTCMSIYVPDYSLSLLNCKLSFIVSAFFLIIFILRFVHIFSTLDDYRQQRLCWELIL